MSWVAAAVLALAAPGITVSAPERVHVDAWIQLDGTVRAPAGERRAVRIEELVGDRWYVMSRTRSTRSGGYALGMRSGPIPQDRTLRVVAPRTDLLPRAATRPFDVEIYVDLLDRTWEHPGS